MKQVLFIAGIIGAFTLSSCKDGVKFFGKSKEAELKIASLEQENAELKKQIAEFETRQQEEILAIRSDYEKRLADLQLKIEEGKARESSGYFVIVGSFKNSKYADEYSTKIKQMGYEGKIVNGPNSFYLVTSGTYTTLKSSIEAMRQARAVVASEAWGYFK